MKKKIILSILAVTVMLAGCGSKQTMIEFTRVERETTTFVPVDEQQHLSGFSQINITELEGLENITEADIYIPIPNEAVWDSETKTFTMPNNNENENGEFFVVTISLEALSENLNFTEVARAEQEEVEGLKNSNRQKYNGSKCMSENNVVIKIINETILEEPPKDAETKESLKKNINLDIAVYDFLEPTYMLNVKVEIIKPRGTVEDTSETYVYAIKSAVEKLKFNIETN